MDDPIRVTFEYGNHNVTIETGRIARQATAAVLVNMDDTVVLVSAVAKQEDDADMRDFFPLTVNYQEKNYAAGKIPGGYFKREGRPTEKETLVSRLLDRPIRPLFPEGFYNEIQIVATVMSLNPDIDPDIPAMLGASAALALSGAPFQGPIGGARVGYSDNAFILNPTKTQLETSQLDLVVAGTSNALLMVESEAKELSEETMLNALSFGHSEMQVAIRAIQELVKAAGKPSWDWEALPIDQRLVDLVAEQYERELCDAYMLREKTKRYQQIKKIKEKVLSNICPEDVEEPEYFPDEVKKVFSNLEKKIVRERILNNEPRIDGRDTKTVRPISVEVGVLPRTHGSALFTRGETQALVVTTLGSGRDAQLIDALEGEQRQNFMLHYNFPPYSVGECGMMSGPKRREIGHGRLAKRAVQAVIPGEEENPYVIRVVSEITESNGSSSMASVCGTSLSLMDAGVPIKAPVAGIAMGLVKEGDKFAVLSDILGDEDHLGDMDFKVAGTEKGITALQMDIKIQGITSEIMATALEQAREGRLHILSVMNQVISTSREQVSSFAPRIITMQINPDKIRDVIGKGGATIRSIIDETGVAIDINDEGVVNISSADQEAADKAISKIELLTADVEVGKIYEGKVTKILDFGAFVNVLPGKDGLVHISQISDERIEDVTAVLSEGQVVRVKVLEIDRQGKVRLSMKEVDAVEA